MTVRPATPSDLDAILRIDMFPALLRDPAARVRGYLGAGSVLVADDGGIITGLIVVDRSFFGHAFVPLLAVHQAYRRQGIASRLVEAALARTESDRLFISTAETNEPMHALLHRLGFERAGAVEFVDPDDREIFYVKFLGRGANG